MANEIQTTEQTAIVTLPEKKERILENFKEIQDLKRSLIEKSDMIEIQGKPYVLKAGWRKLAFAFNLTDTIMREEKEEKDNIVTWRIQVRVVAPNGRSAMGIGACASNERHFAHPSHDCYAMAHTRAKNRAISDILGLGEVSAEEMGASEEDVERVAEKPMITSKQINFANNTAKEKKKDLEAILKAHFGGRKIEELDRIEASWLIDELQGKQHEDRG